VSIVIISFATSLNEWHTLEVPVSISGRYSKSLLGLHFKYVCTQLLEYNLNSSLKKYEIFRFDRNINETINV
jgi:hypothetical protein